MPDIVFMIIDVISSLLSLLNSSLNRLLMLSGSKTMKEFMELMKKLKPNSKLPSLTLKNH